MIVGLLRDRKILKSSRTRLVQTITQVRHDQRDLRLEQRGDRFRAGLGDLLGLEGPGQVTRNARDRGLTALPSASVSRIRTQTAADLTGYQRDDENEGKRKKILRIAHCERKHGGDEEEITAQNAQQGTPDRR